MNDKQLQQLKQIDKEFDERKMVIETYNTAARPHFKSITISLDHDIDPITHNRPITDISVLDRCIRSAQRDIKKFGIKLSSEYLLAKLRGNGIHGAAIYSKRDELDPQFGEFVAKARLLKHVKKTEARNRVTLTVIGAPSRTEVST